VYDDAIPLNRMYEMQLHKCYDRDEYRSEAAGAGGGGLQAQEDCR